MVFAANSFWLILYEAVCFQMKQWRRLLNVRQTSFVVVTTVALILVDIVTERTTAQMALMNVIAVINLIS